MNLDVQQIRDSFNRLDLPKFVPSFYANLFSDFPAAKAFFEKSNMDHMHVALGKSLKYIVDNLDDKEKLGPYLQALGARHQMREIKPAHYELAGQTLIRTLAGSLKEQWNPSLQTQWLNAFKLIASTMTGSTI